MKRGLALLGGLLLLALLLTTTQAFADTYVPLTKPTKQDKTPGAQATERAIEKATDPPGNSEYAKTKGPDKPTGNDKDKDKDKDKDNGNANGNANGNGNGNGNANGKPTEIPGNAYGHEHKLLSNGYKEHFKGTIGNIDISDTSTITVNLTDGAPILLLVDQGSVIKIPTVDKDLPQVDLFNRLAAGMNVSVQAYHTTEGDLVLETLHVIPGKPVKVHRVGVVTDYKENVSITIRGSDMSTTTYLVTETTKLLPAERAGLLANWMNAEVKVTIIAPRDVATGALIAAGIVVHPVE